LSSKSVLSFNFKISSPVESEKINYLNLLKRFHIIKYRRNVVKFFNWAINQIQKISETFYSNWKICALVNSVGKVFNKQPALFFLSSRRESPQSIHNYFPPLPLKRGNEVFSSPSEEKNFFVRAE